MRLNRKPIRNSAFLSAFVMCGLCVSSANAQEECSTTQSLKILAADGAPFDQFGYAVDIDGDLLVSGSIFGGTGAISSGAVYVYNSNTGELMHKLVPSDGESGDAFGSSVGIRNGLIVVGSPSDDTGTGSVYVFDASTGEELHKLVADDAEVGDSFGTSVDINNGIVVVGSPFDSDQGFFSGSAYIFNANTGAQLHKFVPADGDSGDRLGIAVAINGSRIVVGAYLDDDAGSNAGSAYVIDTNGSLIYKLVPDDGTQDDWFGASVALQVNQNIVMVGAYQDDDMGTDSGSVYIYRLSNGQLINKVVAQDGEAFDQFGFSIDRDSDFMVIGSPGDDDNGSDSGSLYIYKGVGELKSKFTPSDGEFGDLFGYSVAMDPSGPLMRTKIAASSVFDADLGSWSGSVYTIDQICTLCPADLNGDNQINIFDISTFLALIGANDPAADFTGDGELNFFDVSAFLKAYMVCRNL